MNEKTPEEKFKENTDAITDNLKDKGDKMGNEAKKQEQKHPLQEEPVQQAKQPKFRGLVIECPDGKQYGMRLEGITPIEALSLLTIMKTKLEKDLGA